MAESLSEKLAGLSRRDQRKAKRGLRQQRGAPTSELLEGYEGDYTAAVRGMQSVDHLAKKYGMGRDEFIALNPKLAGKDRVLAGDTIRLSGTPRSIEDAAEAERLRYTANQPAFSEAQLGAQLQKTQRLQELRDLSRGARQLGDIQTARSLGAERKDLRRELQSGNQFGGIASLMGLRNSDRRNDLNFLRRLSGGNLDPKVQRLQEAIAPRTQEQLQGIYAREMMPPAPSPQQNMVGLGGFLDARMRMQNAGMLTPPPNAYPQQAYQPMFGKGAGYTMEQPQMQGGKGAAYTAPQFGGMY